MRISGLLLAVGLFTSFLAPSVTRACLWDRDTLTDEAKGRLHVVNSAVGYFDRNPPLFYTMRLERVSKAIAATPEKLDLYDDAGVACDRLGRADEAIAWMEKKKVAMDALPAGTPGLADSRYKYLANLGTFHAHRWAKSQDRVADLGELREAVRVIAEAIELNPQAHFGREEYQLAALKWLLAGYESPAQPAFPTAGIVELDRPYQGPLPLTFIGQYLKQKETSGGKVDRDHAIAGLCGIVQLGAAWESVDVFFALAELTARSGHASLSILARERLLELFASNHQSLSNNTEYKGILEELVKSAGILNQKSGAAKGRETVVDYYRAARGVADSRNQARTAYLNARLGRGEHPDTHPGFWSQWKEPGLPAMPGSGLLDRLRRAFR